MLKKINYVFSIAILALLSSPSKAAFYDCLSNLSTLKSDVDSLAKIRVAHSQKFKFSSECLEIVMRKNFFTSSEYLISEYYPKTTIDTELIVKNIGNEVKRNQDYLMF